MPVSETKQLSTVGKDRSLEPTPVPRSLARQASWRNIDYGGVVFLVASYRRPEVALEAVSARRAAAKSKCGG